MRLAVSRSFTSLVFALSPILGAAACGKSSGPSASFPDNFVFGTAVAGFQVDMGCPTIPASECEDKKNDWYQFVTSTVTRSRGQNHIQGDPLSMSPGFYELWEQDLDRVKALGLKSFRFSFEWSRIFPDSTIGIEGHEALKARASVKALQFYRKLLMGIKARGLVPLATVHHYTLPTWIHDGVGCNTDIAHCSPRGWLEPGIVHEIAKYAGFVAKEYGGFVDLWATENEPFGVVVSGFLTPQPFRTNPPAVSFRFNETKIATFAMIDAHARMYDAIKANDTIDANASGFAARVGVVYAFAPGNPKDPQNALDRRAADNVTYFWNWLFLDAVVKGVLDRDITGHGEVRQDLVGKSDYIGVNYYTRVTVAGDRDSVAPELSPLLTIDLLSIDIGATYAKGIYDSVNLLKSRYPGVPLIITENGADAANGDTTPFLVEHLQWLKRAIDEGARVDGYYWWTLMDNYEWNHGMTYRMGLYAMDPRDPAKPRTKRPVADAYSRIVGARAIPADLAKAYPIQN